MIRDVILQSDFLPKTYEGFRLFLEEHDGHDCRLTMLPESWAWLWFQLRAAEDRPEWFPSGKWATLQHLGMLLDECAKVSLEQQEGEEVLATR